MTRLKECRWNCQPPPVNSATPPELRPIPPPVERVSRKLPTTSNPNFCYFFLCTRKYARSLSVEARAPNDSRQLQPELINSSARRWDSSIPKSAGYVAFSEAVSLPAVFPPCSYPLL